MSFDWIQGSSCPAGQSARWEDQYIRDIQARAKLLHNLQFSKKEATRRIQAALAWEFDEDIASTARPAFFKKIPKLVASVYKHAQRGKG